MNTILKIRNPWIINPFFYYGLMWILALIGYELSPSEYCLDLDYGLVIFLTFSLVVAFFGGAIFNTKLKNKVILIRYEPYSNLLVYVVVVLFILEFVVSGGIPLYSYLFKTGGITYMQFGIPTLHVIIVTFAIYCLVKYSFQYLIFKQKKDLILPLLSFLYFLLIYSRGIMLFSLISIVMFFFIDKNITIKQVFFMSSVFVIISWLFGILGNMRVGSHWSDTSYIFYLAGVNHDASSWFSPMYWVLEYLTCSLRTLNFNVLEIPPAYRLMDMSYYFIPDFIAKRIFADNVLRPVLQLDWCTTYTMYGASFTTYGYFGMLLKFLTYVVMAIGIYCIKFKNYVYNIIGLCLLSTLYVFTVFNDMLMYSGYSFSVFYVLLFGKFSTKKVSFKCKVKRFHAIS